MNITLRYSPAHRNSNLFICGNDPFLSPSLQCPGPKMAPFSGMTTSPNVLNQFTGCSLFHCPSNLYSEFTLFLLSWSTNPFYCAALIAPSTIVFSGNGCKWSRQTIHNPSLPPLSLSQHDTVVSPRCPLMFQVGLPGGVDAVEERGAGLVPKNAA